MNVASICLGPLATNTYLLKAQGAVLLVDPAEDSAALRRFVGERSPDLIINTHGHFDHTGGNDAYPSVPLRIHPDDRGFLDETCERRAGGIEDLREGDAVAGLRVVHVPGHSPGSIVLVGHGVMLVGDLLFAGSIGRTDLPGGSMAQMRRSLRRILREIDDAVVYPGHGPQTTLDRERRTNPFLGGWSSP